jgi:phosphate:Na+ symporter
MDTSVTGKVGSAATSWHALAADEVLKRLGTDVQTGLDPAEATRRLDQYSRNRLPLAEAGGAVALEAAWRAILEVSHAAVDAVRRRLGGASVEYEPPREAAQQIEHFLESLSLETTDLGTIAPRLVGLCHALDHLTALHDDLTRIPPAVSGEQPPAGFAVGARALAAWLDATKDPEAAPDSALVEAVEAASKQVDVECKTGRDKLLEEVALQRTPAATARAGLESLAWAESALHHAWGVAESLRIASGA